jgi:hypothetical protein
MFSKKSAIMCAAAAAVAGLGTITSATSAATWSAFEIRQANTPAPLGTPINATGASDGSSFSALIDEAGEKAAYGTSAFDNQPLSSVGTVNFTETDSNAKIPYVNIWVTDGTHYAVIAPIMGALTGGGYDSNTNISGQNIQSLGINLYETNFASFSDMSWLGAGNLVRQNGTGSLLHDGTNTPVLVSELAAAGLTVLDPGTYPAPIGSGAPKNGTGFNILVDGVYPDSAYTLENVSVTAVPEPASLGLLSLGGLALLRRRRRTA